MAALDREVAEERAEAAEAEAEKLNEKINELELEVAMLKEENGQCDVHGEPFCEAQSRQRNMRSLYPVWKASGPRLRTYSSKSTTNVSRRLSSG